MGSSRDAGGIASVGVIGAGAWGTALAAVARAAGAQVRLWALEPEVVAAVNTSHRNPLYLPDVPLDPAIQATGELARAAEADVLLLAVPAQHMRAVAGRLAPYLDPVTPLVICAKGIEQGSGRLLSQVLAETLPQAPLAVLSGPTFAAEVAAGLPTAVTLACRDPELGMRLVAALGRPAFRPYLAADLAGAEVGGAVKNVLAIACGIVEGRNLGDNARAALITRGLAEMLRLGQALGAQSETLMGLCGLGDLVLTCTGHKSRNLTLGIALGQGRSLQEVLGGRRSVAEGVWTAAAVSDLAARLGIEMPIAAAVDAILHRGAEIDGQIAGLLARPFKMETDG